MSAFTQGLKHAFALGPVPAGVPLELPEPLERLAHGVVARGLEIPALVLIESMRPLNFFASQALLAFSPIVRMVADADDLNRVAEALEDRRTVQKLADRIEELALAEGARS